MKSSEPTVTPNSPEISQAAVNGSAKTSILYLPISHLDLFWLGSDKTCLARGAEVIKEYLDRCLTTDETFLIDTTVFAADFLERHPDYREPLLELIRRGRVEIGAAYIDRWETLVTGESLIRNAQAGQRWCIDNLGFVNPVASHPDLPSFTPQTAQIYRQCGIRYYVTSRKIFPKGQVWRYRAPEGSELLVLNYPGHYNFLPMKLGDLMENSPLREYALPLDLEAARAAFPRGTILVAGGAGDLTNRDTFKERLGRNLDEFVDSFKKEYPDLHFGYGTVAQVLDPYDDTDALPVRSEPIPSVWGVAADEEVAFFQRDRQLGRALLDLETLAVAAQHLGFDWRPVTSDKWTGIHHDRAFFGRKHPIQPGQELSELWLTHLFTQDHNGGGQEGVLSSFRKRTLQEAALQYCREGIDHTLESMGQQLATTGRNLLVFNPHGQPWSGPVRFPAGMEHIEVGGQGAPLTIVNDPFDPKLRVAWVSQVPPVGFQAFPLTSSQERSEEAAAPASRAHNEAVQLETDHFQVKLCQKTGAVIQLLDKRSNIDWGHSDCGRINGIRECGNDVMLRIAPDAERAVDSFEGAEILEDNALFVSAIIHRRFLRCDVEQRIVVWKAETRIEFETRLLWCGARDWQVRLALPHTSTRADIAYGLAFYGADWEETAADCGPRNPEEVLLPDYPCYREVIDWVHLKKQGAGLSIVSDHPAFHAKDGTLEAVLLRTATSCGDEGRFWWENAGEQVFRLTFIPGADDWRKAEILQRATAILRPPQTRIVEAIGANLGSKLSLLSVEGGAMVSAIYPHDRPGLTAVRLVETTGQPVKAVLTGALANTAARLTDLMNSSETPPDGEPGHWIIPLQPWAIQTVLLGDTLIPSLRA